MKRKWVLTMLTGIMLLSAACSGGSGGSGSSDNGGSANGGGDKLPTFGAAIYRFDDTFMTGVRNSMKEVSAGVANIDIVDSQNSQPTQNEKVDLFLNKKYEALIINPVDRTAATDFIRKAKEKDTPIVFINREPVEADMQSWDKVYYVGAKAEESGTMSGQIIADYWEANESADKNGDGVLQYIMLSGEPGHQDAELRTTHSVKALEDAGIKVEKLASDFANWDRVKGQEKMQAFLASHGDNIEAVLSNNDDMALGAIEALVAAGYLNGEEGKFVPVVGVDATAPAIQAMKEGKMLGTVLNDAKGQGAAAVAIASALAKGETPTSDNIGYDLVDDKYVWIEYKKITKDNIAEAE
ncbi:galactose ABC transporter substrate-binding protein [Paenibacillus yanchengensis]|uniref:D-galactose/methyl-galactoside binding periplasmic protein MglB n=1 Tax=Paenibacillus yanchengensis TaxID=2035833 RepID=A0ABW4YFT6_9BACL